MPRPFLDPQTGQERQRQRASLGYQQPHGKSHKHTVFGHSHTSSQPNPPPAFDHNANPSRYLVGAPRHRPPWKYNPPRVSKSPQWVMGPDGPFWREGQSRRYSSQNHATNQGPLHFNNKMESFQLMDKPAPKDVPSGSAQPTAYNPQNPQAVRPQKQQNLKESDSAAPKITKEVHASEQNGSEREKSNAWNTTSDRNHRVGNMPHLERAKTNIPALEKVDAPEAKDDVGTSHHAPSTGRTVGSAQGSQVRGSVDASSSTSQSGFQEPGNLPRKVKTEINTDLANDQQGSEESKDFSQATGSRFTGSAHDRISQASSSSANYPRSASTENRGDRRKAPQGAPRPPPPAPPPPPHNRKKSTLLQGGGGGSTNADASQQRGQSASSSSSSSSAHVGRTLKSALKKAGPRRNANRPKRRVVTYAMDLPQPKRRKIDDYKFPPISRYTAPEMALVRIEEEIRLGMRAAYDIPPHLKRLRDVLMPPPPPPAPQLSEYNVGDIVDVLRTSGVWDISGWVVADVYNSGNLAVKRTYYSGADYGTNRSCDCGNLNVSWMRSVCSLHELHKGFDQIGVPPSRVRRQVAKLPPPLLSNNESSLLERKVCTDNAALILEFINCFELYRTVSKVCKRLQYWSRVSLTRPRAVVIPRGAQGDHFASELALLSAAAVPAVHWSHEVPMHVWYATWAAVPNITKYVFEKTAHNTYRYNIAAYKPRIPDNDSAYIPACFDACKTDILTGLPHSNHLTTASFSLRSKNLRCISVRFPNLTSLHVKAICDFSNNELNLSFLQQLPKLQDLGLSYEFPCLQNHNHALSLTNTGSLSGCANLRSLFLPVPASRDLVDSVLALVNPDKLERLSFSSNDNSEATEKLQYDVQMQDLLLSAVSRIARTFTQLKAFQIFGATNGVESFPELSNLILREVRGLQHVDLKLHQSGTLFPDLPERTMVATSLQLTVTCTHSKYSEPPRKTSGKDAATLQRVASCVHYMTTNEEVDSFENSRVTFGGVCPAIESVLSHFPSLTKLHLYGDGGYNAFEAPSLSRHLTPGRIPNLRELTLSHVRIEPEFQALPALEVLKLYRCDYTCDLDILGRNLACLPRLSELWIEECGSSVACIPKLVRHLRLTVLCLKKSRLTMNDARQIFKLGINPVRIRL